MAQTTYSLPVSPPQRVIDAMCSMFQHAVAWKRDYNIDFVSVVRNGANMDVTFSDPVPLAARQHIKVS